MNAIIKPPERPPSRPPRRPPPPPPARPTVSKPPAQPARQVQPAAGSALVRAEQVALAFAIEAGNKDLPPAIAELIRFAPESFADGRCGKVAVVVRSMAEQKQAVYFRSVAAKCGAPMLMDELGKSVLPRDIAEMEAESALAACKIRRATTIFDDAANSLRCSPFQAKTICEGAIHRLSELTCEFESTGGGLPEITDATVFMDRPQEMPPELVAGVLHKGNKLALGGSSKAHKSWLMLDMAISVATGADWIGFATEQGKVLYCNFEIQNYAWQKRIEEVVHAKEIELKTGALQLWNLRGHCASFREVIPLIIERARRESYALIIVDPIYKLLGGAEENSATDIAELSNALERLAVETSAAVAYAHHFAKGNAAGKDALDRMSGSGVFARDPDSLLIFTKHEDEGAFVVEPILRNFPPVKPFGVRWEFPLMHRDDEIDPAQLKGRGGRPRKHLPEDLLELLPKEGLKRIEWLPLAKEKGIKERTFCRLLKTLQLTKKIHMPAGTAKWLPI